VSGPGPVDAVGPTTPTPSRFTRRARYRFIAIGAAIAVVAIVHFANTGGLSPADVALNNWLNTYQHPDSSVSYADTTALSQQLLHPSPTVLAALCVKGDTDFRRFQAQPLPPDAQMRAPWEGQNTAGVAMFSDCLDLGSVSTGAQVRAIATRLQRQALLLIGYDKQLNAVARARGLSITPAG
jgi:hypothetical protein